MSLADSFRSRPVVVLIASEGVFRTSGGTTRKGTTRAGLNTTIGTARTTIVCTRYARYVKITMYMIVMVIRFRATGEWGGVPRPSRWSIGDEWKNPSVNEKATQFWVKEVG